MNGLAKGRDSFCVVFSVSFRFAFAPFTFALTIQQNVKDYEQRDFQDSPVRTHGAGTGVQPEPHAERGLAETEIVDDD